MFKTFFQSQFKYCPLAWMIYSRTRNNRMNQLHERAFRPVYNDHDLLFDEILEKYGSFTVHSLHKKWSFPLRISSVDLVTFTEEILKGKLHFCAVITTVVTLLQQKYLNFTKIFLVKLFLVIYSLDKKIHITFMETEFQIPWVNTVLDGYNSNRYF